MEIKEKMYLKKFMAMLHSLGVNNIPFSGELFHNGISAMEEVLEERLDEDSFDSIAGIFVKTPVQESYNKIRDIIMTLNGDIVGFTAVDNPYWSDVSIKMNDYYALKLLSDSDDINIRDKVLREATLQFCNAAGVATWEQF